MVNSSPGPLLVNPSGGNVGIAKANPAYALDITGDCNVTGVYRVNGTPISGGGGITTQSIVGGSRSLGTIYQNGAKPQFVTATIQVPAGQAIFGYTDSSSSPTQIVAGQTNASTSATDNMSVSFWVLPNNYFKVTCSSGGSVFVWTEWT